MSAVTDMNGASGATHIRNAAPTCVTCRRDIPLDATVYWGRRAYEHGQFCADCICHDPQYHRFHRLGSWADACIRWPRLPSRSCQVCGRATVYADGLYRRSYVACCPDHATIVRPQRRSTAPRLPRPCACCGEQFTANRDARYCSNACRQMAYRQRQEAGRS